MTIIIMYCKSSDDVPHEVEGTNLKQNDAQGAHAESMYKGVN